MCEKYLTAGLLLDLKNLIYYNSEYTFMHSACNEYAFLVNRRLSL